MTKLDYWLLFFPNVYYRSIILSEMNKKLNPGRPLSSGGNIFAGWAFGIYLPRPMAITVDHRQQTTVTTCVSKGHHSGKNHLMSRTRFEEILEVSS
jgi:hypothetical protein